MRCLLLVAMVNYSSCSRLLTALNASAEAVSLAWTPLVGSALHKGDLHKLRDCWSVPIKILHGAKPNVTTEEVTLCLRGKGCNRNVASKGYPECDYISMRVNTKGAWDEYDLLVKFIHAEAKYHEHAPAPDAPGPLVLDVGANQGMCTHSILLHTKARVVAFEPNPSNQFFLTQSLLLLARRQPDIAHRVVVLPVGLADVEANGVVTDGTTANRTARAVSNFGDARITLSSSTATTATASTQQPRAGCGCGCARARAANGARALTRVALPARPRRRRRLSDEGRRAGLRVQRAARRVARAAPRGRARRRGAAGAARQP